MNLFLTWKIVKLKQKQKQKQLLQLLLLQPLVVMRLVGMCWVRALSLVQTPKILEVLILIAYQQVLIFFFSATFVGSLIYLFLFKSIFLKLY